MAIFAITFQACRKEAFTEQLSASTTLKNPITSDAAKAWFQNKFGETKLISPSSISSSSDTLDGYYFDASYEITPLWSESKIAAFLQTNPILLVPVKPIPFLDAKGQHYTLVFFRDSLNQLDARLQVYQATSEYAKNNPKFRVENFTGFFYQIHLTGKVDKVCGVEQGKFTYKVQLKPKEKSRIGKIQTRGLCDNCFSEDHTASPWDRFRCNILCAVFESGNSDPSGPDTYINVGADGSWLGLGSTNDYTNDPPTYSGDPTSGSGGTIENNYNNTNTTTNPNYLAGELGNEIFDMTEERATLLTIHRRLNMNIVETDFLKNNREAALQMESYLLSHTTTVGTDNAHAHLTSLMNNAAYRLANQQAAYVATIIETLGKYTKAGFTAEEFVSFYSDKNLFKQVETFLNSNGTNSESIEIIKTHVNNLIESPGYGTNHPVTTSIRTFNWYIWRAFEGANNISTIGFHNQARGLGSFGDYGKSIGAIGEGIVAKKIADEASFISFVSQNSRIGGYQHDIMLEVPLLIRNGVGTHDLRIHFTDENGNPESYTQDVGSNSGRLKFGRVSYEVKTYSEDTPINFLINGFEEGVQQVIDRTSANGVNAGVLVFDKNAFDVIKNDPRVINAMNRLNNLKTSNNQKQGFLRIESGLRQESNNAYYALVDRIKNLTP